MVSAIVYTSNSGYTEKYAKMLAEKTTLPVYRLSEAKNALCDNDEIIYMGWICAGTVKGYEKASKKYDVKVLCAVGMQPYDDKISGEIAERHKIKNNTAVIYLRGGYDNKKLHGIYKLMMNTMARITTKSIEKNIDKSDEDIATLDIMKNGGDFISAEKLEKVIKIINM